MLSESNEESLALEVNLAVKGKILCLVHGLYLQGPFERRRKK